MADFSSILNLDLILALIASLARTADVPGHTIAEELAPVLARLLNRERTRTGLSVEEICERAGLAIDSERARLLDDFATEQGQIEQSL